MIESDKKNEVGTGKALKKFVELCVEHMQNDKKIS